MGRRRAATSKRRRPRLSGKVLRPRAESIFPGYASYRILVTTVPLKRCSNTNNRALAINLATRSNRATRFETKRANKTQDGRRSIDLWSINGQPINRSTNEVYTVSTWSVHLVAIRAEAGGEVHRWAGFTSSLPVLERCCLACLSFLLSGQPENSPRSPCYRLATMRFYRLFLINRAVSIYSSSTRFGARAAGRFVFRGNPLPAFPSCVLIIHSRGSFVRSFVSTRFFSIFYVSVTSGVIHVIELGLKLFI